MQNNHASPLVVKYGGNAMAGEGLDPVIAEVAGLHRAGTPVVLIHGGGPEIDRRLAERSIVTQRVDGLRITDAATLEVTEAVLCATVNKRLVRLLTALGVRAAGISGEDGELLRADRVPGLGSVGGNVTCDPALLETLLAASYLPVVAPLALASGDGGALNVNADLAAAAIAAAMRARAFVLVTNVTHVLADPNDPSSAIERMTLDEARAFERSRACAGGMRPKMQAAIAAVAAGASRSLICGAAPRSIAAALDGEATTIR